MFSKAAPADRGAGPPRATDTMRYGPTQPIASGIRAGADLFDREVAGPRPTRVVAAAPRKIATAGLWNLVGFQTTWK